MKLLGLLLELGLLLDFRNVEVTAPLKRSEGAQLRDGSYDFRNVEVTAPLKRELGDDYIAGLIFP